VPAPREEWIAVPVPDAGIPRQWVLSAREVIRENEWASNAGYRTWKLAGGVLRCDSCGRTISVNYIPAKERGYYRCTGRYNGEWRIGAPQAAPSGRMRPKPRSGSSSEPCLPTPRASPRAREDAIEKAVSLDGVSAEVEEASWLKRISEIGRK
jgi:hypothetical protein